MRLHLGDRCYLNRPGRSYHVQLFGRCLNGRRARYRTRRRGFLHRRSGCKLGSRGYWGRGTIVKKFWHMLLRRLRRMIGRKLSSLMRRKRRLLMHRCRWRRLDRGLRRRKRFVDTRRCLLLKRCLLRRLDRGLRRRKRFVDTKRCLLRNRCLSRRLDRVKGLFCERKVTYRVLMHRLWILLHHGNRPRLHQLGVRRHGAWADSLRVLVHDDDISGLNFLRH